mmetsp:Transcript_12196/g.44509  ORF Transcript_12196/g.44509 Transcript_12196/m.44509 type:complete len:296 (+) Transcript_12196:1212-2099(+)
MNLGGRLDAAVTPRYAPIPSASQSFSSSTVSFMQSEADAAIVRASAAMASGVSLFGGALTNSLAKITPAAVPVPSDILSAEPAKPMSDSVFIGLGFGSFMYRPSTNAFTHTPVEKAAVSLSPVTSAGTPTSARPTEAAFALAAKDATPPPILLQTAGLLRPPASPKPRTATRLALPPTIRTLAESPAPALKSASASSESTPPQAVSTAVKASGKDSFASFVKATISRSPVNSVAALLLREISGASQTDVTPSVLLSDEKAIVGGSLRAGVTWAPFLAEIFEAAVNRSRLTRARLE